MAWLATSQHAVCLSAGNRGRRVLAAARLMEEARLKLSGARRRCRDLGRLLAAAYEHLRTISGISHCAGGTEKLSEQVDERAGILPLLYEATNMSRQSVFLCLNKIQLSIARSSAHRSCCSARSHGRAHGHRLAIMPQSLLAGRLHTSSAPAGQLLQRQSFSLTSSYTHSTRLLPVPSNAVL